MKPLKKRLISWDSFILLLLLSQCIYYGYQNILPLEPQSRHVWRQSDGASYAWNYATQSTNFFEPRMNNLALNGNGKVATEFPIIYYASGMIYRLIGVHPWIHRLINISILFFGLFSFYQMIDEIFHSKFWAIILPMFLFTTPLLVFYSNNFLPDVPAFALSIAASYYFFRYSQTKLRSTYRLSLYLFALAALIKLSYLLVFFSLIFLFILERNPIRKYRILTGDACLFHEKNSKHITSFALLTGAVLSWYIYASWYSTQTLIQHFFSVISSTPQDEQISFGQILRFVFAKIQEDFFILSINHFWILFLSLGILFGLGKNPKIFRICFSLLLAGILLYLYLFRNNINGHDYYFTPLFLLLIPVYLYAAHLMESYAKDKKIKLYLQGFIVFILLLNIQNAKMEMQYCYYGNQFHYQEKETFYKEEFRNYLLEKGVKKDSKIISYPDPSMNNTLYLMRRRGWSSLGIARMDADFVTQLKTEGAEFLILNDTTYRQDSLLIPALGNRIGSFEGIDIYDLSELHW